MESAKITANHKLGSEDPIWCFLAEFSLGEFMSDHDRRDDLTAKLLFQTVRELGISPDCVENIEMTLTGFAKEALVHFKPGAVEVPERIRVFCQKKMIASANLAKTSVPYYAEPGMKHAPAITYPGSKINGGWGYFLIERGGNLSAGSCVRSWNSIDLYLYKEGE